MGLKMSKIMFLIFLISAYALNSQTIKQSEVHKGDSTITKMNIYINDGTVQHFFTNQIDSITFTLYHGIKKGNKVTIDWTTFPDGSPIPNETQITNQFQSLGIVFLSPPGPPEVLSALGGILISGGQTSFFGDTHMSFIDVGYGLPTSLTIEIIGSGLNIAARLEAFDIDGKSLGTVTHTYSGNTGQLSPFTFFAPAGKTIASAIYNGGLNPNAAASIGTLIFSNKVSGGN